MRILWLTIHSFLLSCWSRVAKDIRRVCQQTQKTMEGRQTAGVPRATSARGGVVRTWELSQNSGPDSDPAPCSREPRSCQNVLLLQLANGYVNVERPLKGDGHIGIKGRSAGLRADGRFRKARARRSLAEVSVTWACCRRRAAERSGWPRSRRAPGLWLLTTQRQRNNNREEASPRRHPCLQDETWYRLEKQREGMNKILLVLFLEREHDGQLFDVNNWFRSLWSISHVLCNSTATLMQDFRQFTLENSFLLSSMSMKFYIRLFFKQSVSSLCLNGDCLWAVFYLKCSIFILHLRILFSSLFAV